MTIFWTKTSKKRFLEITEYLEVQFGESSKNKFSNKTLKFLELLSKYPRIGSLEVPEKDIYGFQISKQTRLFYRIHKGHISLLTFFDSRQNPDKRPK